MGPTTAHGQTKHHEEQLRTECDALVQSAVKRGYGWGWDPELRGTDPKRPTSRPVSMEPLGTPAAALLLLWAGQMLDEPKFVDAAIQAARGIATAQLPAGKIPVMPTFAATAGGRDEPAIIPDRASTRAALGLLLSILDDPAKPRDERLDRAARRAAQWMLNQQTDIGGWPSIHPPDAPAKDAIRILRLDRADYRDSCLAMLMGGEVLQDKLVLRANEKMMSHLLSLRRDEPGTVGNSLWYTAYKPNGAPAPAIVDAPAGPDVLASRYAMQVLFASYLLSEQNEQRMALDTAALTLGGLRRANAAWDRYPEHPEIAPPVMGETNLSAYGLPELLTATNQLKTIGRQRYLEQLASNFTAKQHIAQVLVGLSDDPFTLDMPTSPEQVNGYLERHAAEWRTLNDPTPQTLEGRVKRLWVVLVRAKVEKLEK
jgi:hypothetical protein